jgi:hypothetical protein
MFSYCLDQQAMNPWIAVAVWFGLFATMASGKIGESEEAIAARYGTSVGDIPTQAFGKIRGFQLSQYIVGVAFANGVSNMEMFSKADQSDMTATEIKKLLEANGAGEWKAEGTGKPNWRRWRRDDEALVALYDAGRHFLYISSKKFYEEQVRKLEEVEAERLKEP